MYFLNLSIAIKRIDILSIASKFVERKENIKNLQVHLKVGQEAKKKQ